MEKKQLVSFLSLKKNIYSFIRLTMAQVVLPVLRQRDTPRAHLATHVAVLQRYEGFKCCLGKGHQLCH